MKILVADDEIQALEVQTDAIRKAYPEAAVYDFFSSSRLLAFARENSCDIAFLDIQMRGMSGVDLARKLKTLCPRIHIIFVTSFSEFTGAAMSLHVGGYIMKPVTAEKIKAEVSDLQYRNQGRDNAFLLKIHCFGNFDVFTPDNRILHFECSRAKEVLAYLVYLHGASCTVREIAALLFEDGLYDRKQQTYVQKMVSSMLSTLRKYHAESIIEESYNSMALNTFLVSCDYYDFMKGTGTKLSYPGKFMSQYSWAEYMTGYLERIQNKF